MRIRVGISGVLFTLLLSSALFAQDLDTGLVDRADAFRKTVRRHDFETWLPRFMEALLGGNYEKSQPEVASTLQRVAEAADGRALRTALAGYEGDAGTLTSVLDAAAREAKGWKPGRVISHETINELWSTLYGHPPEPGREFRLESYPVPKSLDAWLVEEQRVNDKIMRFPETATIGDLPVELDPMKSPMFWLPHVEIPIEEARILKAELAAPRAMSEIVFERDGRTFVRWFVHPASTRTEGFRQIMKKYPVRVEYLAMPTSSPRSLAVWDPHGDGSFVIAKTSLDATVGTLKRINRFDKATRAIASTRALDAYYGEHQGGGRSPPYLREPMVVFPPKRSYGMIVREVPNDFPSWRSHRLVPGSALASSRPDGGTPLLVDMIRQSGRPPMEYLTDRIITPFMKTYGEITFKLGLVGEPHQQNVLLEIGRDGQLTGRLVLRDMDSYKVDVEQRLRQGLGVRDLFPFSDPGLIGRAKLTKARKYYNTSYFDYVREDWGYMLSHGLEKYFPEVTEEGVFQAFDSRYVVEVKKHLGIDVAPDQIEPNRIIRAYRDKMRAEPVPSSKVSQRILGEEFARLAENRRVLWVGPHAELGPERSFFLHDGAIEMREGRKVIGFALLEPRDAKNFYEGVPYPRQEPDPKRLARLYDAVDHGHQARENVTKVLREEGLGLLQFAAAYLVKEGIEAIETRDPQRMKEAAGQLKQPVFWGSVALFSAVAKVADFGLTKLPLPSTAKGLSRAALPLAAGMAAIQALSGRASWRDIVVGTGSFLAAGFAVNFVADGAVRLLIGTSPAGWVGGLYTIGKLALTLYAGEKLENWLRGRLPLFRKAAPQDGVQRKVEALGVQG